MLPVDAARKARVVRKGVAQYIVMMFGDFETGYGSVQRELE